MHAAQGNPEPGVVRVLVDAGARVNAKNVTGMTPLLFAAEQTSNPDVLLFLLQAGADARAVGPRGETCLTLAEKNGRLRGSGAIEALARALR
jgi:ankyrin repeat protein